MEAKLGVWIRQNSRHVYGDGRQHLLKKIGDLGSIRQAALEMGMSYRAAWGKIKATEEGLGIKLLERTVGGKAGGGAILTEEAKRLIGAYEEFRQGLDELVNERLTKSLKKQGLVL